MNQKICAIMQPTFLPWTGYFKLIDLVDYFIFLDDVQLIKRSFHVRNKIKNNDKELLISIPVNASRNSLIMSTKIDGDKWKKKHLNTLFHSYKKAEYFENIYEFMRQLYFKNHIYLSEINFDIITAICKKLKINSKFLRSSDISTTNLRKEFKLVDICKKLNVSSYLSPIKSSEYIEKDDTNLFSKNEIKLFYFEYKPKTYQQTGNQFISHLSIIDLLFNCGFEKSAFIIKRGKSKIDVYEKFNKSI